MKKTKATVSKSVVKCAQCGKLILEELEDKIAKAGSTDASCYCLCDDCQMNKNEKSTRTESQ